MKGMAAMISLAKHHSTMLQQAASTEACVQ
jgi:hypothetical protein